jgi:transposase
LKKDKVKYNFAVKSKEELDRLSHEELLNYVKNLQDNLIQEKPPKNSNNSSIPSSIEIANPKKKGKNQSLRQKSDRLAGGQKGRVGVTLNQSDTPDEIEEIPFTITSCKKCGESLTDTVSKLKERRQVLDIKLSSIDTQIKEYQSFSKICSVCGYDNHDNSFTKGITPNISYGSNITAMVSYLSVSQYMAHKRIVSLLSDLFNINIAEGTINSLLKKASKLSQTEIQKITTALESASLVGIDETGCKINSSKHWHWTFQNTTNTLVVVDKSRGTKVINKNIC